MPVLHRLQDNLSGGGLHTIIPGAISVTRGKADHFRVKISCITPHGYKAIARRGKVAQEVFFTSSLSREELQKAIDEAVSREQ